MTFEMITCVISRCTALWPLGALQVPRKTDKAHVMHNLGQPRIVILSARLKRISFLVVLSGCFCSVGPNWWDDDDMMWILRPELYSPSR